MYGGESWQPSTHHTHRRRDGIVGDCRFARTRRFAFTSANTTTWKSTDRAPLPDSRRTGGDDYQRSGSIRVPRRPSRFERSGRSSSSEWRPDLEHWYKPTTPSCYHVRHRPPFFPIGFTTARIKRGAARLYEPQRVGELTFANEFTRRRRCMRQHIAVASARFVCL